MAPKKKTGQGTLSTSSWTTKSKPNPDRIETKASIKADLKRRESEREQALLNPKKSNSDKKTSSTASTGLKRSASVSSFGSVDSKKKRDSSGSDVGVEKKEKDSVKREKLDINNKGYDNLWAKTSKAMGLPKCKPIHAEGETRIEQILRVFDLDPKYGPCSGLTRMERWERAEALGDEPPLEIKEILETREGFDRMQESVLFNTGIC